MSRQLELFFGTVPGDWSDSRRWCYTFLLVSMPSCVQFSSSIFSTSIPAVMEIFHVGTEVATLGTSLFLLGFGLGGLFWAPVSEWVGRRIPLLVGYFVFIIFQIPVGVTGHIEIVLISRFIQGFFGSSTLAVLPGAFADIWPAAVDRSIAMTVFTTATFAAPIVGSITGSFIAQTGKSWTWTTWITMIIGITPGVLGLIFMPETYKPNTEVAGSASTPPRATGMISAYLLRQFRMLFLEPTVFFFSSYLALVYGLFYLFFTAFPISFHQQRGWPTGVGSLPFLAVFIGIMTGSGQIIYHAKTSFARKLLLGHITPEDRLPPMMAGAVILPIGLFIFGWTSSTEITWVPQALAGVPIGFGIVTIFLQAINYMVDCYKQGSNSALASSMFLRGMAGTAFPLFASRMYAALGVNWGTSVLGFVTACLVPVPFLFYRYGAKLRSLSRFTPHLTRSEQQGQSMQDV